MLAMELAPDELVDEFGLPNEGVIRVDPDNLHRAH